MTNEKENRMSILDRYLAYADAFELSLEDDDWTRIEPFFTEGAVSAGGPEEAKGRDAVFATLKQSLDTFDRRMDSRKLDFDAPTVDGDTLRVRWSAKYTKAGAPDLVISGVEIATFEGDRIARLEDEFDPEAQKAMGEWMVKHAALLQGD